MKTQNPKQQEAVEIKNKRQGSNLNSFLAGAATVLVLIVFGGGGFLLYRAMQSGQIINPFNRQANKRNPIIVPSTPAPISPSSEASVEKIPQNPYIQTALDNKAQVELLSVTRNLAKPSEVIVQMRVRRMTNEFVGSDIINVGATTAQNPVTKELYQAVDSIKQSSGPIFLFNLPPNQTIDGYITLNVPPGVNSIDILVKDAGTFRNVLISNPKLGISAENGVSSGVNQTPVLPNISNPNTTQESNNPAPTISPTPSTTVTEQSKNSAVPQATNPVSSTPAPTPKTNVEFQPGAFKQLAYGNNAQVDLLSAKRIVDPQTGNRDVVNVQMRIRRLADKVADNNIINVGETTARNPVTSETFKAVDPGERSTGNVSLAQIRPNASVDAYVWLKIPPNVNTLDIYVPETGAIRSVPISN